MKEYIKYLYELDKVLENKIQKIESIEKDYTSDKLRTTEYNERKNRIEKVQTQFEESFKKIFSKIESKIKSIREIQPQLTDLSITKKHLFPKFIIFGRLKLETDKINFNKEIYLPRVFDFPLKKTLYSFDLNSIVFLQQFVLRVLQISPLSKLEFVLIDNLNLGHSLGFMRGLLDNDFIYKNRILTYSDEIEESLRYVSDFLENLIQRQLVDYKDWEDYNKHNPKSILLLKVLVLTCKTNELSKNSLLYLTRIAKFGPKAGVLPLIILDDNNKIENLQNILDKNGELFENIRFKFKEKVKNIKFIDELEPLPNKDELNKLIYNINDFYDKDSQIKGEIDEFWNKELWKHKSTNGIKIPIGWDVNREKVYFKIGSNNSEHHTLIGGRSGSGKSNLLHIIIQNIAYFYSPNEVELFLLDYKEGVEFNSYVQPPLLHASLIAIHSDINYGYTFLKYIIEEKDRRSELFKQEGVKDYSEYREKTDNKLSRIVIVIDEFQVLFTLKDSIKIEKLFVEILRKGRSYGIHLILSTQTLKGVEANSLSQLKSQIGNRLALVMSEEDSMAILSTQNTEAAKLKGKPEAIYNSMGGVKEGNKKVYVPFASRNNLETLLTLINEQETSKKIKIYDGEVNPVLPKDSVFVNDKFQLLLGKESNFNENDFFIQFKKEMGNNLIVSGRDKKQKQNIISTILKNLTNNSMVNNIYYLHNDEDIVIDEDISICNEEVFNDQLEENSFIIIDSFDGYQELQPAQNFGMKKETSLADKFKEIVEHGYKKNIVIIIFIDNYKRVQAKHREFLSLFELRYGFNLNEDNANALLSVSNLSMLKSIPQDQAIFSNLITSEIVYFKPYKAEK